MKGKDAIRDARRASAYGWQRLVLADEPQLPFEPTDQGTITLAPSRGPRALEDDSFPFESPSLTGRCSYLQKRGGT